MKLVAIDGLHFLASHARVDVAHAAARASRNRCIPSAKAPNPVGEASEAADPQHGRWRSLEHRGTAELRNLGRHEQRIHRRQQRILRHDADRIHGHDANRIHADEHSEPQIPWPANPRRARQPAAAPGEPGGIRVAVVQQPHRGDLRGLLPALGAGGRTHRLSRCLQGRKPAKSGERPADHTRNGDRPARHDHRSKRRRSGGLRAGPRPRGRPLSALRSAERGPASGASAGSDPGGPAAEALRAHRFRVPGSRSSRAPGRRRAGAEDPGSERRPGDAPRLPARSAGGTGAGRGRHRRRGTGGPGVLARRACCMARSGAAAGGQRRDRPADLDHRTPSGSSRARASR